MHSQWLGPSIRECLFSEGVIAYPTEGVWGLGCLVDSRPAVQRILDLKQRSWQEGLILVGATLNQFDPFLEDLPGEIIERLQAAVDYPTTYLIPDNGACPDWIKGRHASVAIRVSGHPVVRLICRRIGGPLVSTSANRRGLPSASSQVQARRSFGDGVDLYVPGGLSHQGGASRIVDATSGRVIRNSP